LQNYNTPYELFGQLFVDLHLSDIFPDGKTISDAIPLYAPEQICSDYEIEKIQEDFSLEQFFHKNFKESEKVKSNFVTNPKNSIDQHIDELWEVLARDPSAGADDSSLIPLPYHYIVPGGRFNEIYYWDSFFTMLGLAISGKTEMIEGMVNNFSHMADSYGHIPNGNRTYFLSRSQPPFFAQMVSLLGTCKALTETQKQAVLKEYEFWMQNERVIQLEGGILNRYFDFSNTPREEMYKDDYDLAKSTQRSSEDLFESIRAACESGWDFSSRWYAKDQLESIQTSSLLPVDLNCLLYTYEQFFITNNLDTERKYWEISEQRRALIQDYFWSEELGYFVDYNFVQKTKSDRKTLAGVFPLTYKLASQQQADSVAKVIKDEFIAPGGLRTTLINSGQQWDAPNGWAPLQWTTVKGLDNYGFKDLAKEIATRWVALNEKVFRVSGKFVEKYNVEDIDLEAGGGEYPVQDGFGWSIGVYMALKKYLWSGNL